MTVHWWQIKGRKIAATEKELKAFALELERLEDLESNLALLVVGARDSAHVRIHLPRQHVIWISQSNDPSRTACRNDVWDIITASFEESLKKTKLALAELRESLNKEDRE